MKTIRTGKVDKLDLRLVEKDGAFIGLIFAQDGVRKAQIEGAVAADVWRRLHDEAGKANPKYFGFDGARTRFLRFFPNGFQSEGFATEERDYKVRAKSKLDLAAPLADAVNGSGFGEAVTLCLSRDKPPVAFRKDPPPGRAARLRCRRVHSRGRPLRDWREGYAR